MEQQFAYIQVKNDEGFVGENDERPNVKTYWFDGVRYDIAVDKIVRVPLFIAEELKRKGEISSYTKAN